MSAHASRREFAKGLIDSAIRQALATTGRRPGRAFVRLLWNVQARSGLLRPSLAVGRIEVEQVTRLVDGLLALFEHRKEWLRPVESWEPRGSGTLPLFSSLAHHLLSEYPVPPVLLSAWFQGREWPARQQQNWFKRAGQGQSLREVGFPIRLTRRMAHEFANAPAHFSIEFALRWAQVRGLGGSEDLARSLAATRLGREFEADEFWVTLIHLFINARRLDPGLIEPIVEYLNDQKFEHRRVIIGEETELYLDPPQPDLCIKGCTVASLSRRVAEWQARRRPSEPERRLIRWDRSAIGEYRREEEGGRAETIRELIDSDALVAEGKAMRHCVADYTYRCLKGRSTIWSLGLEGPEGRRRLATIEVNPETKEVIEAKAKANEEPDEFCATLLREWADREGLKFEG